MDQRPGNSQIEYGVVREAPALDDAISGEHEYGVEITAPGSCNACVIKENCYGTGAMVRARSSQPLRAGESVRLEMRAGTVLRATVWVYGIPLLALIAGLLPGHYLFFSGLVEQQRVLLSAGLGLGLMFAAGWVLSRLNDWIGRRVTIRAFRVEPQTQS